MQDRGDILPQKSTEPTAQARAVDRVGSVVVGEMNSFSCSSFDESETRGLRPCFLRGQCHKLEFMPVVGMVSRSAQFLSEKSRQVREAVRSRQGDAGTHDRSAIPPAITVDRDTDAEALIVKVPQVAYELLHSG
ncbi:hypothetical protein NITMOv2_3051 [Nitrospira moscoviensis]|uniref:Uncharacterized protein n=1 Tax=Nitrospira moscoviensis TaxID=42253 RepID=A0A0K2GES4_NITMO|nr:hypothetical protein NITMOv2_3051 [Nitrospira moscoviensis]